MIEYLRGKILAKDEKGIVLNIGGVGYRVFLNSKGMKKIGEGDDVTLFTYMAVREDAQELYGFLDKEELEFFKLLIGISGVGPKIALNILAVSSIKELKKAIVSEDPGILTMVSGIGKKTAERVVVELKNKVDELGVATEGMGKESNTHGEAVEALIELGYNASDARKALLEVDEKFTVEEKVREALKQSGKI